jgi:hypothetical protein
LIAYTPLFVEIRIYPRSIVNDATYRQFYGWLTIWNVGEVVAPQRRGIERLRRKMLRDELFVIRLSAVADRASHG